MQVMYIHTSSSFKKMQAYLKSRGFPGSPGTVNKGSRLHGHESWPTIYFWYPDHNIPGEVQKSSKWTEHLVMA